MPIYLVSGKLGSGKTLACVGQIREAIWSGRRVATNLDLHLDKLLSYSNKSARVVRIPDKPTVDDLELLGSGNDSMDETKNGIIVLDELAAWLNARSFNDKSRQPVLDWLIHSRKKGWDVYFICQNIQQIDKQVRESLVEYLVSCRRLDRIKIPFVGKLLQSLSAGYLSGNLPKVHVGVIKYGTEQNAPIADRWVYMARDLYAAYDTRQVFTDRYPHGVFTYLPPWYTVGWQTKTWKEKLRDWLDHTFTAPVSRAPLKPKHPLVEQLSALPEDEALRHWRRLDARGYWDKAAT